jgi:hypothetical protein
VYVRDCEAKNHIYVLKHCQVKDNAKKLRFEMNRGCQAIRGQETQYKREKSKEKNTPNPEKKISPQYGRQFCYKENHSMSWGKPQQMEMTTEINSNLRYSI